MLFEINVQAACLARCNGAKVDMARHGEFTEQDFRQLVISVCTSGEEHLIVSYSRKTFQQTGDGHFSPIGGYHRGLDLVLILDVARFKYPPHWVPLPMLYEAMSHLDPVTGMPRGYLLMSTHQLLDSAMFTLDVRQEGWQQARGYVLGLPSLLEAHLTSFAAAETSAMEGATTAAALITSALNHLVHGLPVGSAGAFLMVREQAAGPADRCIPHKARETLLAELRGLPLYQVGGGMVYWGKCLELL